MTSPTDPRDALAQRLHGFAIGCDVGCRQMEDITLSPRMRESAREISEGQHAIDVAAILADGSRYLSPAQAAERDRLVALGKAVERLPDARGSVLVIANYSDEEWEVTAEWWEGTVLRHGADRHRDMAQAIAAALDEPVTGEPLQPHRYSPDAMTMGDCRKCGHVEDSPLHQPVTGEPER